MSCDVEQTFNRNLLIELSILIEVVSKPQIRFKGKASRGLETESAEHSGG